MGSGIVLEIDGWRLEIAIKDHWVQFGIVTNDVPPKTHYVRASNKQGREVRDYLNSYAIGSD